MKQETTAETTFKKSGLVALVGRANAGKSTLLNALVGTKLAIATPKPQTTRQTVQGVLNAPQGQAVFVDTPGYFQEKRSPITAKLNQKIFEAIRGIDLILYVVDPTRQIGNEERFMLSVLRKIKTPKILVINKIDQPEKELDFLEDYRALQDEFDALIEVSALKSKNIKSLIPLIFEYLKEGEPLYPPDSITNIDQKFFISELVREKIFHTMGDEVPYTAMVETEKIEDKGGILVITAVILTTAPRYRKMLIGAGGRKIKEMGTTARKELEIILNRKIFLDLRVEVDKDWERRFE
ncbi:MAG: GTPase Era [Candidatus Magasanikbacteria bacterium]|nr:GTPase Era [Candidatus Magasanikbacteria bacterium]